MIRQDDDRIVFSSERGRLCPECGAASGNCRCKKKTKAKKNTASQSTPPPPPGDGTVRVSRTRRGRKGKTVTLVEGVPGSADELRDLASDLKKRCGTGGAIKEGVIEIQGDQRETLVSALEGRGFRVKVSGG